jgi:hypothetical protein
MATFNLSWTPAGGGNSTGQEVWSRPVGGAFVKQTTLSNAADSYALTLSDNTAHEFKVVNLCSAGGPTDSALVANANVTCVGTVTTSDVTTTSLTISFPHLKGHVNKYTASLKSGATVVSSQTQSNVASSVDTLTFNFTSLTAGQSYDLEIIAAIGTSYTKTCQKGTVSTSNATCNAPTGVSATISEPPAGPTVTITATSTDNNTSEETTATWTYHLSEAAPAGGLIVYAQQVQKNGATVVSDEARQVTIPAGQTSYTENEAYAFYPSMGEAKRTLTSNGAYVIGSPASATVLVGRLA